MQLRELAGVCDLHHLPFLESVVTSYGVFLQHPRELEEAGGIKKRISEFLIMIFYTKQNNSLPVFPQCSTVSVDLLSLWLSALDVLASARAWLCSQASQ